ncbi:MAG: hypothetical protein KF708_02185, partial [Pirellulales bacterium]|nr:hypothetical protein [Pirellulales bacterium]
MLDPKVGRFLTEDPIWPEDDTNAYRYVSNNPTNFTDPTGLAAYPIAPDHSGGGGLPLTPYYEEYVALGGPTYTDSDYRKVRAAMLAVANRAQELANNGRCDTLRSALERATVLAD